MIDPRNSEEAVEDPPVIRTMSLKALSSGRVTGEHEYKDTGFNNISIQASIIGITISTYDRRMSTLFRRSQKDIVT